MSTLLPLPRSLNIPELIASHTRFTPSSRCNREWKVNYPENILSTNQPLGETNLFPHPQMSPNQMNLVQWSIMKSEPHQILRTFLFLWKDYGVKLHPVWRIKGKDMSNCGWVQFSFSSISCILKLFHRRCYYKVQIFWGLAHKVFTNDLLQKWGVYDASSPHRIACWKEK